MRQEQRALEAKDSALQSALNDLARTQSLLTQREADLIAVQTALQTLEADNKKLGESHTTARFSLQLEVDRLRRDVERLEDELTRARKELDDREGKGRDRNGVIDKLHAENRDLAAQLAAQTQARLNVSEKLDDTQASLRAAESETATLRTRISELEQRLSKDQRALLSAEAQYRDQLTERNTLLLTIYQYMDKIVGVDKTPVSTICFALGCACADRSLQKKHGQAETKPFTNFSVFHDNLITRLKALSQIQTDFEKRTKEAEQRYADKLNDMRKQLDLRWKQIDKFEASVKTLAEAKALWRKKLSAKEGEIEALQVRSPLSLLCLRRANHGDATGYERCVAVPRRLSQGPTRGIHGGPLTHRPSADRGASRYQPPESTGRCRGESHYHQPEDGYLRQQMGSACCGIREAPQGGAGEGQAREARRQGARARAGNSGEVRVHLPVLGERCSIHHSLSEHTNDKSIWHRSVSKR